MSAHTQIRTLSDYERLQERKRDHAPALDEMTVEQHRDWLLADNQRRAAHEVEQEDAIRHWRDLYSRERERTDALQRTLDGVTRTYR
jgi:hypothetical protein